MRVESSAGDAAPVDRAAAPRAPRQPLVAVEAAPDVERVRAGLSSLLASNKRAHARLAETDSAWQRAPSLADAILGEPDVCVLAERFAAAMRTEASSERPERKAGEVLRSAFEFVLPEGMRVHARLNPTDEGIREAQTGQLHVPTADARIASIVGRPMAIRRSKRSNALDSPFCVDLEHLPNTEIHRAEHAVTVGDELLKRLVKVQPSELAELVDRFIDAGVIHRAPAGDLQGQLRFIAIRLAAAAKANGAIYYGIITERCSRPLINLLLTEMPLLWLLQTMRDGGYELDALLESSI